MGRKGGWSILEDSKRQGGREDRASQWTESVKQMGLKQRSKEQHRGSNEA